jgi:zinc protease
VKKRGFTDSVDGGINLLGNQFNYQGPMLWIANLVHDSSVKPDQILAATDSVIQAVSEHPVTKDQLSRALVKFRAHFYEDLTQFGGLGRADLMASYALFDDNPAPINDLETNLRNVTPELIQKTAQEFLRPANRTILTIVPGASNKEGAK